MRLGLPLDQLIEHEHAARNADVAGCQDVKKMLDMSLDEVIATGRVAQAAGGLADTASGRPQCRAKKRPRAASAASETVGRCRSLSSSSSL